MQEVKKLILSIFALLPKRGRRRHVVLQPSLLCLPLGPLHLLLLLPLLHGLQDALELQVVPLLQC